MSAKRFTSTSILARRRTLLSALLVVLSVLWLSACSSAAPPAADEPVADADAATAAETDGPQMGGVYRAAFGEDTVVDDVDAATAFGWADWWASNAMIYNRLYGFDDVGNIVPELAAELPEVSEDGLVYTIELREGVLFHNGEEMKADDVKFSFDRGADPALQSPAASYNRNIVGVDEVQAGEADDVSGVRVIDDYTVEFTLKEPQSVFPAVLGISINGIVPREAVEAAGNDWGTEVAIGTGPFRFVEMRPSDAVIFERFDNYFREGLPYLDGVEIYMQQQPEVSVLRWESGELEMVDGVPAAEISRISADPELSDQLLSVPSNVFYYMQLADNVEPFTDPLVRQAIAMAIDKQALADSMGVSAARVQQGLYTPNVSQHDPDFESDYQYDPEAAQALLAEAGYADGLPGIDYWIGGVQGTQGQIIQSDLAEIGIEVNILQGDYSLYKDRIESGEIPIVTWGYAPDFPDGYPFVADRFACESTPPPPPSAYCNEEADELVQQTNGLSMNSEERTELFRRVQEIVVNEDAYLIPLYNRNSIGLRQPYAYNDSFHRVYDLPAMENVWMEQE